MTDRPVLFSAPMVKAILDGRKSMTRRVIKPRGDSRNSLFNGEWSDGYVLDPGNAEWRARDVHYAIGDVLWVREAWRTMPGLDHVPPRLILAPVFYEAGGTGEPACASGKLRPGMFMPRWASRITLKVTGVKVERLQDISEEDAIAEGVEEIAPWEGLRRFKVYGEGGEKLACPYGARISFSTLWESINGPGSWEANPWVVAISFERTPTEAPTR